MISSPAKLQLTRTKFSPHGALPSAWAELYRQIPSSSVFLSPEWTLIWIETYGAAFSGDWLVWHEGDTPVAATLFLKRRGKFGPTPVELGVVNTSNELGSDGVYIEYNDILCLPHARSMVCSGFVDILRSELWDQLLLSGYTSGSLITAVIDQLKPCHAVSKSVPSPFVDLSKVRDLQYESVMSGSTRSQIRRTAKLYAERGAVIVHIAESATEAHEFLNELAELHQTSWSARGAPGAFASARFKGFHHKLIDRLWNQGNVHLVKITAGKQLIGVLYNFYREGKVYFYQSGFAYENDNRMKPGLLSHALAIRHYAELGASEYDFLAGDGRYKKSLATGARQLSWTTVDRHTLKMRSLRLAANWKKRTRRHRSESQVN